MKQIGVDPLFCLNCHVQEDKIVKDVYEPFLDSIKLMKNLTKHLELNPNDKMELMVKISKSIVQEIENYYDIPNDKIPTIDKSKLVIDADQLLMILIYVLAQS